MPFRHHMSVALYWGLCISCAVRETIRYQCFLWLIETAVRQKGALLATTTESVTLQAISEISIAANTKCQGLTKDQNIRYEEDAVCTCDIAAVVVLCEFLCAGGILLSGCTCVHACVCDHILQEMINTNLPPILHRFYRAAYNADAV